MAVQKDEHFALSGVTDALKHVDSDAKLRILKAAAMFYGLHWDSNNGQVAAPVMSAKPENTSARGTVLPREPRFTGHVDLSPKQFLEEKQPQSDVERVACLAYYLSHYRSIPHFKTVDISKLNTEAAQFKFSNAASAVNNAAIRGLLTSAGKGNKQISAVGEQFVVALPDREMAKRSLERIRFRRDRGKSRQSGKTQEATKP